MSFFNVEKQSTQKWIDNCYELIFNELRSNDKTIQIVGLGQFELMYHLCRNFDLQTKYHKTLLYKKAFNMVPRIRHMFETKVSEYYEKELQEMRELNGID